MYMYIYTYMYTYLQLHIYCLHTKLMYIYINPLDMQDISVYTNAHVSVNKVQINVSKGDVLTQTWLNQTKLKPIQSK